MRTWPPTTSRVPSGWKAWPEQKRLTSWFASDFGYVAVGALRPVKSLGSSIFGGVQRKVLVVCWFMSSVEIFMAVGIVSLASKFQRRPQERTLPVGRRLAWTGTLRRLKVLPHWPALSDPSA